MEELSGEIGIVVSGVGKIKDWERRWKRER